MSLPGAPLRKGALVQLMPGIVGLGVPNIVLFQYNPQKISHSYSVHDPYADRENNPEHDPRQSFSLSLELDATDDLEQDGKIALRWGVADRLAALKKLMFPSNGLLGDLLNLDLTIVDDVERPTIPVVLFVWNPGRVLPVRVTSFSVEETLHSPKLFPLHATVSLGLEVLTPSMLNTSSIIEGIAVATYQYTHIFDDVMAIVNAVQNITRFSGMPPL
jgi:hypothetical protein